MAITTAQVESALAPVIRTLANGTAEIVLTQDDLGAVVQGVDVPTFVALFGGAADLSAASLSAIDAGKMGYAGYIATWKTAGYIS